MPSRVERRDLMLVPYILLSCAYMATFQPFYRLPPETFAAAILKAAPIWYLAAYVGLTPKFADNSLALGVRVGLVLSSLGDMCLVWRQALFLPGMFFFALAQMAYIYGLKSWLRRGNYAGGRRVRETAVVCVVSYGFLFTGMNTWFMAACVLVYSMLLFAMANLSLQRHIVEGNRGSFYGMLGGMSFLVSDFLIGFDKWKMHIPMSEGIIMATYYVAQGLSLSVPSFPPVLNGESDCFRVLQMRRLKLLRCYLPVGDSSQMMPVPSLDIRIEIYSSYYYVKFVQYF